MAVQVGSKTIFKNHIRKHEIQTQQSAPRRLNKNPPERSIGEIRRKWCQIQENNNIPDRLWDYGIDYVCETESMTVNSFSYFNGRTDLEIITSETIDVSEYLDFGLSFCITYQNNDGLGLPEIARWIGVSHQV